MINKYFESYLIIKLILILFLTPPFCAKAQLVNRDSLKVNSIKQLTNTTVNHTMKINSWKGWDDLI